MPFNSPLVSPDLSTVYISGHRRENYFTIPISMYSLTSPSLDYRILRTLAKKINEEEFSSRLVYQGYRPSVSLDLHIRYGQKAGFNDESIYYDVLIPKHIKQKAIEEGLGLHSKVPRSPVN